MPVTVTSFCPTWNFAPEVFLRVSLVRMALAILFQFFPLSFLTSVGTESRMFSTGSGTPMMPVEQMKTWRRRRPISLATALQILRALTMPDGPVQAFALPLLTMRARISSLRM